MPQGKKDKFLVWAATVLLWLAAAWLLLPLVHIDRVDLTNVKSYLYRTALGLTLLIIFFGKTLFDLVFPWVQGRKLSALNAALLSLYALMLSGGILLAVLRLVTIYLKSRKQGFVF